MSSDPLDREARSWPRYDLALAGACPLCGGGATTLLPAAGELLAACDCCATRWTVPVPLPPPADDEDATLVGALAEHILLTYVQFTPKESPMMSRSLSDPAAPLDPRDLLPPTASEAQRAAVCPAFRVEDRARILRAALDLYGRYDPRGESDAVVSMLFEAVRYVVVEPATGRTMTQRYRWEDVQEAVRAVWHLLRREGDLRGQLLAQRQRLDALLAALPEPGTAELPILATRRAVRDREHQRLEEHRQRCAAEDAAERAVEAHFRQEDHR